MQMFIILFILIINVFGNMPDKEILNQENKETVKLLIDVLKNPAKSNELLKILSARDENILETIVENNKNTGNITFDNLLLNYYKSSVDYVFNTVKSLYKLFDDFLNIIFDVFLYYSYNVDKIFILLGYFFVSFLCFFMFDYFYSKLKIFKKIFKYDHDKYMFLEIAIKFIFEMIVKIIPVVIVSAVYIYVLNIFYVGEEYTIIKLIFLNLVFFTIIVVKNLFFIYSKKNFKSFYIILYKHFNIKKYSLYLNISIYITYFMVICYFVLGKNQSIEYVKNIFIVVIVIIFNLIFYAVIKDLKKYAFLLTKQNKQFISAKQIFIKWFTNIDKIVFFYLFVTTIMIINKIDNIFNIMFVSIVNFGLILLFVFLQYFFNIFVDKFVLKDFNYKINGLKKSHSDRLIIYNKISGSMFLQSHLKNIFYYPFVSVLIVVILNNLGLINFVNIMDNLYNYLLFKILFNVIVSIYFIYIITVILIMINRYFILKLERRKNFALVNKLVSLIFLARKIYILLIIAILFLVIITSIKLSLATLLASTGIFTLIIGFGAKDVLTSFFSGAMLFIENVISVNDLVEVSGKKGVVEDLTMRYIKLRDVEGTLHMIPFSDVNLVSNFSKDFSYAVIDVSIDYGENIQNALDKLKLVGEYFRLKSEVRQFVLEDLNILGVANLGSDSVDLKCRFKTVAGKQSLVKMAFLQTIKEKFDEYKISIPFKYTNVILQYKNEDKQ